MKYWILLLFIIGQPFFARAADIYFKQINVEHGLSHKKVNCILQDRRGFVWFGTEDGLNRYDGRYMVTYRYSPGSIHTLSGNIIKDLHEDNDGILWIATQDGGMTKYDYRLAPGSQFKQYRFRGAGREGIPENSINKIAEDRFGNLWLATSAHYTVRFNKTTEKFDTPVALGTRCIYTLAMTKADTLLVGRAGGGLLKINTRDLHYKYDNAYDDLYAKLPHVSITDIFMDSSRNTWIASWDKTVYRWDSQGHPDKHFQKKLRMAHLPPDDYLSFAEDSEHQIWMAGKQTGLVIYNGQDGSVRMLKHDQFVMGSLGDDHANVVYAGKDGTMWIGTENGVSVYNPLFKPFEFHKISFDHQEVMIYDFFKESGGRLLIGTNQGIFVKTPGKSKLLHIPLVYKGQALAVTKFFQDKDNRFFIGTDYTLFLFDLKDNKLTPLPNTGKDPVMKKLIGSRVVSVIRDTLDGHPVLLVSPYGHFLTYYDLKTQQWVSREDTVKQILSRYNVTDNLIRLFYRKRNNDILLATSKNGLGWWSGRRERIRYLSTAPGSRDSLSNNDVFDIKEDANGNLWISTYGGGVSYFSVKTQQFKHLQESSNLTEGMLLDQQKNLWMLCNGHVHRYCTPDRVYSCYDIPEIQHTSGLSGYLYQDGEGTVYAAGRNYFITFDPARVAKIRHDPPIYFTDFKVFQTSFNDLLYRGPIKLNYARNSIKIEFSAPEYSGDNLRYSYMLEGFDKVWIASGKRNFAEYANLRSGEYTFRVTATNWKGQSATRESVLHIVIDPPFWLTSWFIGLLVVSVCGICFAFYRNRIDGLLAQQRIRNNIAQDLHDQIGSTLSSIALYSEVAKKYSLKGDVSQLNDLLSIISDTCGETISEMSDIVWAINPKNDLLQRVFHRVKNYAEPLCNAKGIRFELDFHPTLGSANVDMPTRKNLYLILKEAINNAVKHSGCQRIRAVIDGVDHLTGLMVADDGAGFDPGDKVGQIGTDRNGLGNIYSRAAEMGATVQFNSQPGMGTTIRLWFKKPLYGMNFIP
ncbi:sensor histidine kinase [Mucilaginibacter terrae]|uniref:Signal transduction histidine kinase/ligand-binding sensor domain-containing protein n=1 Tax=Mucilaginibacter terrae TaxID=1955052 RepID=A0ABU3GRD2_9SPHI|nr:two-component regulator propeller domain-containing protein [Mucilaginibacter terrae]MDT3402339.1 signal transduction histidine kinase/ligand-binding sensor domain-containing protein [Mucilaginibacter terrae]